MEDEKKIDQNPFRHEETQPPYIIKTFDKNLDIQRQRLAIQLQGLGQLTGKVAHQVNNLLCVIGHYLNQEMEKFENGEKDESLEVAFNAYIQIVELVKKLQDFGRPSAATLRPVDVNKIIEDTIAIVSVIHGEVEFECIFEERLPFVLANSVDIQQMFLNIFINAYDAIRESLIYGENNRPAAIKVMTRQVIIDMRLNESFDTENPGKYILISIDDTGIGIKDEDKAKIFEPYFSTKSEHGTGIGLAIVDEIVKKYKGWINVDSVHMYGTTFSIYLPLAAK